eukprot:TRINITY_DN7047_c0_g1_i1.p1 TRINITY_DN7047_c0_g1~~TRINITY_DN7047_c0_g1_i1.p1  ORF type:complete len:143 (+),score=29.24 TRINITY_DN7047_c0_g1_i1:384-812(+)
MLIDKMDPQGMIMYRLYKDHMRLADGEPVKDLDLLNRDLSKVIVVDDNPKSLSKHRDNLIKVKPFVGDGTDRELIDILPLIASIVQLRVGDVREVLSTYQDVESVPEAFKERQRQAMLQQQEALNQQQAASTQRRGFRKWFG